MKRRLAATLILTCIGAFAAFYMLCGPSMHEDHRDPLAALTQTLLPIKGGEPLRVPTLVAMDGTSFASERLRGLWSLVFFGFTRCPDVCPTTLQVLGKVTQDSASGISTGATQIVFVSIDPIHDTPERIKSYLEHFGGHMVGLSGSRDAVDRFVAEIGAGYRASGSGIDHSTSLFVLDPKGRLAGVMLRPNDPVQIITDLKKLQASSVPDGPLSVH